MRLIKRRDATALRSLNAEDNDYKVIYSIGDKLYRATTLNKPLAVGMMIYTAVRPTDYFIEIKSKAGVKTLNDLVLGYVVMEEL